MGPVDQSACLPQDGASGQIQRRAFNQQTPKRSSCGDRGVEGDQASKRGSANPGVFRALRNSIFPFDEWHYFAEHKFRIALALRPEYGRVKRTVRDVLAHTVPAGVVDSDDNHWWNRAFSNQSIGR